MNIRKRYSERGPQKNPKYQLQGQVFQVKVIGGVQGEVQESEDRKRYQGDEQDMMKERKYYNNHVLVKVNKSSA